MQPRIATLAALAITAILDKPCKRHTTPTRNVNLTDRPDRFIETGVASRFSNASEMVREGLRLLEQREQENQAKLDIRPSHDPFTGHGFV